MSKKSKRNKVKNLAAQNAQKSVNRKSREKQKRQQVQKNNQLKNTQTQSPKNQELIEKAYALAAAQDEITGEKILENDQQSVEKTAEDRDELKQNDQESVKNTDEAGEELKNNDQESAEGSDEKAERHESNDRQSVLETVEVASLAQDELVSREPAQTDIVKQTERELQSKRRRKIFPLVWWILGLVAVIALVAGGYFVVRNLNNSTEVSETENSDDNASEPDEEPETPPEEEKPEEPEEPPVEEKPVEKPVEQPSTNNGGDLAPIAPRPSHNDYPEVTPGSRLIALTFDDGPSPANTPRLLDILSNYNVKATFFVLGNLAERNPAILQREAAEGHEVASHTPYHDQLTTLSSEQVRWQALEMDRIFTNALGTVPPFTRPPYGAVNAAVQNALGQPLIFWSIDPRDWADRNATIVCNRVVSAAFDGAIILLHDIHATSVDAVPCIVENLRAQGYEFLTVSDLAAAKDVPLVNGQIYYSF